MGPLSGIALPSPHFLKNLNGSGIVSGFAINWKLPHQFSPFVIIIARFEHGRTHGAPYRGHGYIPLRFGVVVVFVVLLFTSTVNI